MADWPPHQVHRAQKLLNGKTEDACTIGRKIPPKGCHESEHLKADGGLKPDPWVFVGPCSHLSLPVAEFTTMPQQTGAAGGPAVIRINAQFSHLNALHARREALGDQYQDAMAERSRVAQERLNAQARGDVAMVHEYDAVVTRIGNRMQDIERTRASVDQQIDEAMKSPLQVEANAPGAPGEPVAITFDPRLTFDEASRVGTSQALVAQRVEFQRMMVIEGGVFLLLGALLWRFGVLRGRRQAVRAETPRDETKLQQAIDAIAIEVERLSEGQRFTNNILSTKRPEREALPVQSRPMSEPRDGTRNTPH